MNCYTCGDEGYIVDWNKWEWVKCDCQSIIDCDNLYDEVEVITAEAMDIKDFSGELPTFERQKAFIKSMTEYNPMIAMLCNNKGEE